MTTILKTTSKGQLTIPAKWRNKFKTDRFLATIKENSLELEPLIINNKLKETDEFTVFDAIRDNQGKGIKAKDLVNILKEML